MANWDTASKRYSGMGLGDFGPCLLPIPDGAFGTADREHLLDLYAGIALDPPSAGGSGETGAVASSAIAASAIQTSAIRGNAFGRRRR